ncbi:MAG: DUF4179 domain-containing protein [Paraclostridium sp.]
MSKFDDIKIPDNIDEMTEIAIKRGIKYKRNKINKRAIIASISIILIGIYTIEIGIRNPVIADSIPLVKSIIEYFEKNNESLYNSDINDLNNTGSDVNLKAKDNGIELIVDSMSIDDNYITIFYTIKADRNIKKINEDYKDAYFANPIVDVYTDGKKVSTGILIEHEAKYISDRELKGMRKIDISNVDIKNNDEIEIKTNDIFGIEGKWSIFTRVDKSKSNSQTYNYNINKDFIVDKNVDYKDKKIDIQNKGTIEKVIISPLANKIVISEKYTIKFDDWQPMMGNSFALFDENKQSLDIVDQGGSGFDTKTGIATNSIEFLKATKDTKQLTIVPMVFDYDIENYELEAQSINKLPIVFKMSEYGNLVIEDIKITDKEIRYTYYKDGVVPHYPNLWFYDEHGNEIQVSSSVKESLNRNTGRYTTILNLGDHDNNISKIKKISKVSTYTDSDMKLIYDQAIKIDLER